MNSYQYKKEFTRIEYEEITAKNNKHKDIPIIINEFTKYFLDVRKDSVSIKETQR